MSDEKKQAPQSETLKKWLAEHPGEHALIRMDVGAWARWNRHKNRRERARARRKP